MKNSNTPKIVVGVGLAAIYAVALAAFMPRDADDNVVAQNASPAPLAQVAPESVPSPAIVPAPADTLASVPEPSVAPSVAMTAAATPVASVPAKTVTAPPPRSETAVKPQSQSKEQPVASVATASPTSKSAVEESIPVIEGNAPRQDTPIAVEVESQTEAVAADDTSDATTDDDDDAVEVTGVISSQE